MSRAFFNHSDMLLTAGIRRRWRVLLHCSPCCRNAPFMRRERSSPAVPDAGPHPGEGRDLFTKSHVSTGQNVHRNRSRWTESNTAYCVHIRSRTAQPVYDLRHVRAGHPPLYRPLRGPARLREPAFTRLITGKMLKKVTSGDQGFVAARSMTFPSRTQRRDRQRKGNFTIPYLAPWPMPEKSPEWLYRWRRFLATTWISTPIHARAIHSACCSKKRNTRMGKRQATGRFSPPSTTTAARNTRRCFSMTNLAAPPTTRQTANRCRKRFFVRR